MNDPSYRRVDPDEPGFWSRDDVALWGAREFNSSGGYNGRIASRENEAALGLCWLRDVIEAISQNGKPRRLGVRTKVIRR